jgi:hypothetical protein
MATEEAQVVQATSYDHDWIAHPLPAQAQRILDHSQALAAAVGVLDSWLR